MRVIKLSPDDVDMTTPEKVAWYFEEHLAERDPCGQFLLTKGRIREDGIAPADLLVFSYLGDIVYIAHAASERMDTEGRDADKYPHFFCVDVDTIRKAAGRLSELEDALREAGLCDINLARTQGWPNIDESGARRQQLERILETFM